jgi:DNA modification methylase
MGIERTEVQTETCKLINNDSVEELEGMDPNSVHLILTSIPFSTQYEYTPSYNDFGHTDGNEHFFAQMDFLTPRLFKVLKPGRVCAIHVKDRIVPGGITGLGFQTVYPFHCKTLDHFVKHGFAYMGMKTIVTDVVRENNQTYRLGWTEQCKDGTKMGVGMPEYLLIFRKPPTDTTNAYADEPVVKHKPMTIDEETGETGPYDKNNKHQHIILNSGYSRARWQLDAHGFERSSGNRLLTAEELEGIAHHAIYKKYRHHSLRSVYDYENHVAIAEALEQKKILPVKFMLLPPQSWHPDVWTDITRMRTLNGAQSAKGKIMHLCPMQFDLANRVIAQNSMEGEVVLDPFGGLGTVGYCAVPLKRRSILIELNADYFRDGVSYVKAAEQKTTAPTLFDITDWTPKLDEAEELADEPA